jgi:2-methylisocitrate lyase-like PEP mutase family enzyme
MMSKNLNARLKERLVQDEILVLPGAANALGARVIEDIGFEAVYVTGAGIANTYLGAPDVGLVTLTELSEHVAAVRDAVELPLVVDVDTGYGNALNVARTVKVLERSGANAIQLEDQVTPKKCGHFDGKEVITKEEMVQKIHAAVDARRDDAFMIIARTDARASLGFEEAVERVAAYAAAGADVTFLEAPQSVEEMEAVSKMVPVPQVINMVEGGRTPLFDVAELEKMGFAIALYANLSLQGAIRGMQKTLDFLYEHGSIARLPDDDIARWDERQRLVRKPVFYELERRYAVEKQLR